MHVANKATKDELDDLHRGVHLALDALVNRKDYGQAENVLRQIDARLADLLNRMQVITV